MPISAEELERAFELSDKIYDNMSPEEQLASLRRASPPLPPDHPWHAISAEFLAEEAKRAEALRVFAKTVEMKVPEVERWIKQICPAYEPPRTE